MIILGISAYYHDSSAALIIDGKVVCAIEEERFTRVKHDNSFPLESIRWCLKNQDITINDVDYVVYYEKPLLKFERILETWIETYPFSLKPFIKGLPEWLEYKIKIEHTIKKKLAYKKKIFFIPHHISHASASFYPSSFNEAAILTIDGVGEYQTTGLWKGKENKIYSLKSINFPHSLGLLYSTFTAFLGFKVNEDEYKMMGLAAYGKPIYRDKIYSIINVKEDGSFKLNLDYFSFREDFTMWNKKFEKIFGRPRASSENVLKRHKDLAASVQLVTEEIYIKILNYLHSITNIKYLCVSGGVGLNALANGKIHKNTPFEHVYILGSAGDNGNAIGAALFVYHNILNQKKRVPLNNLCIGSEWSDNDIVEILKKHSISYEKLTREKLIKKTAELLSKGKVIGWFEGKMEFGPRALGARSILARPFPQKMKEKVNIIKRREQFRPFAGSVLEEDKDKYFETPGLQKKYPFMNFCFQVKESKRKELEAIVHKDGSCRIQTVSSEENNIYYDLIREFKRITGIGCILNTSFNLKGEPMVETPQQAILDFIKTEIDYLVMGNLLIRK